jgi:hypothetical protein
MQQRMKLAGEWNCRRCCELLENGIAERKESQKMQQKRMELLIHEQRIEVQENGIANA